MEVVVHGNDTVKIVGLPAATTEYTVEEKTDWSWRYDPTKNPQSTGVIKTDKTTVKLTFENERDVTKWLNGDFWCQNIFKDSGISKTGNVA